MMQLATLRMCWIDARATTRFLVIRNESFTYLVVCSMPFLVPPQQKVALVLDHFIRTP